ncbi:hypothetical protein BKP37_17810 [Anaerobacillus alkalilacustris]|uniref:Uncharacterized protein n=1 Tax=Anaerobacillus alkalilacustris TaxID=393763 RepID=A0A1S2LFB0_9BACI|nr:hypothetical protein BKP37_17810 [Anaerobacillus alkalilacustris]
MIFLGKQGRKVHKIKSDLEFVRSPATYTTFLADSAGAILLADYYNFDSLSNGHTLEEGYESDMKDLNNVVKLILFQFGGIY